ncbi:UNKNOWN [Stylonychia lemnae]|uniref:Sfi1 spindle body domain-containing protein n=1 Tax=Stylonychia lemnae TaxID=5949 RepID=A0A078ANJ2_STYLE|nr:UNKNOWN [Stylonychia lemnae]|eukprot:CDW82538.1 UNKNOWN [Stylonychia lemnae]
MKNAHAKFDQVRLIQSYEYVLKQFGLDPLNDSHFYKILMEIENYRANQVQIQQQPQFNKSKQMSRQASQASNISLQVDQQNLMLADQNYSKCLKAKTFFSLVQNMVSNQISKLESTIQHRESNVQRNQPIKQSTLSSNKSSENLNKRRKNSQQRDKENMMKTSKQTSGRQTQRSNNNQSPLNEVNLNNHNINAVIDEYQVIQYKNPKLMKNVVSQQDLIQMQRNSTKSSFQDDKQITQPSSIQHTSHTNFQNFDHSSSEFTIKDKSLNFTQQNSNRQLNTQRIMNQSQSTSALYSNKQIIGDKSKFNTKSKKCTNTDYKLLLKTMRCWKQYIKIEKRMKAYEEKSIESWALSIHYYEQTLITKSFLCLQRNMISKQIDKKGLRVQKEVVQQRALKKFFKKWQSSYDTVSKRRNQMFKALNHWGNKIQGKVIKRIRNYLMQDKHARLVNLDKYLNKPSAIYHILTFTKINLLQEWTQQQQLQTVLNDNVKARFQDFTPYIAKSVENLYLRRYFENLVMNKERGVSYRIRADMNFKQRAFKKLRQAYTKINTVSRIGGIVEYNHSQRLVWTYFGQWLGKTTNKILNSQKMDQAEGFHQRNLKQKSIQGFLLYLNKKHQTQSQLKQSVRSSLSKAIRQTFQGWKFVTLYNRKFRHLLLEGRKIQTFGLKSHYFMIWIKTAIVVCKARMYEEQSLKKRAIQGFQRFIEHQENQRMHEEEVAEQFRLRMQRKIYSEWLSFTSQAQTERNLRRTVFKYMQETKMRQIIKRWRDQNMKNKNLEEIGNKTQTFSKVKNLKQIFQAMKNLTETKRTAFEKYDILNSQVTKKVQSQVLLGWLQLFSRKLTLRQKHKQVAMNHIRKQFVGYFLYWLNLTSNQEFKRTRFFRRRAFNLSTKSFTALKQYSLQRNAFKKQLHGFLKNRANNLMFKALQMIFQHTKQNEIQRKLRKVSAFIYLEKALKKHYGMFKRNWALKKKAKQIRMQIAVKMIQQSLQIWKKAYACQDIVNKFRITQNKQVQQRQFEKLKKYANKQSIRKNKIRKGLFRYVFRLCAQSIVALKQNLKKVKNSRIRKSKVYSIYQRRNLKTHFNRLKNHHSKMTEKRQIARQMGVKARSVLFNQVFNSLRQYSQKKIGLKLVYKPMLNLKNRKIQRACLLALYKYSFEKSIQEASLKRFKTQANEKTRAKIFDAMIRFKFFQQYLKDLNFKSKGLMKLRLYRKSFFVLIRNKLQSSYHRSILRQSRLNITSKYLQHWITIFNELQYTKPLENTASTYILKKIFTKFCLKIQESQQKRQLKQEYEQKALEFFERTNKSRAIKKMMRTFQVQKLQRMKNNLSRQIFLKKIFNKWRFNLVEMNKGKTQHLLVRNFRAFWLQKRALTKLEEGVQVSLRQQVRANQIRNQKNLKLVRKCYYRLAQNVQTQSFIVETLKDKMKVMDRIMMRPKFYQWKVFLSECRKNEKAKYFRVERGYIYIIRKYFDQFRINTLEKKQLKLNFEKAHSKYNQNLQLRYFAYFIDRAIDRQTKRKRYTSFSINKNQQKLQEYFYAMIAVINELRLRRFNNMKAVECITSNLKKKSLICLQRNHCLGQIQKMIERQSNMRVQFNVVQSWKKGFLQSQSLNHIVNTLQNGQNRLMMQQLFSRLVKLSFYQQIFETLESKRILNYSRTFIALLKRKVCFTQIVYGFDMARGQIYKQNAFRALVEYNQEQQKRQTMMMSQLNIVIEETNNVQMKTCFEYLQANAYQERMKKQALSVYIYRLKAKAFQSLIIIGEKQLSQYYATNQIKMKRTMRYFCSWIQSFQKAKQENLIKQVHETNTLNNVVQGWREYTQKQKAARYFHTMKLNQNAVPLAFDCLRLHSVRTKQLRQIEQSVSSNHEFCQIKTVLLNWMQYHNLKKISMSMRRFHGFKLLKVVIDEWSEHAKKQNERRMQVREMQENFYDRPYLIRPLLVIRNVCIFKAFQALKMGTQISNESIVQRNNCLYLQYSRLLKKGFYSLRMFVSKRQQDKKIRMLRNYFITRRWFYNLRNATYFKRCEDKRRRESAIFKVLNVQRKAFNVMLQYASERQQERIKIQFAEEMYYKRLADRVLISFKINVLNELQARESQIISGQNTLQNCDLTMGINQSRFEQDLSNLQIECTQVQDYNEKKRLVTELYLKKLLYKCFVCWGNQALCVSEDEEERSHMVSGFMSEQRTLNNIYENQEEEEYASEDEANFIQVQRRK